jgi:hypothetical protein
MPAAIFAPPATDGSIGCAGSTLSWQVSRQSSHGMPAIHASRMRAWVDIEYVGDGEWLRYQVGETSMIDRGESGRQCGMTACTIW